MHSNTEEDDGEMIAVSPLYPNADVLTLIGEVCFLCFHSKTHQDWSMREIGRIFEPPIYLKQSHIYRARAVPRALVTWARLDLAAEEKHMSGAGLDSFDEWQSGDQFWIVDLMAPWGHGKAVIKDILENFAADNFKALRIRNGKRRVVHWRRKAKGHRWRISIERLN